MVGLQLNDGSQEYQKDKSCDQRDRVWNNQIVVPKQVVEELKIEFKTVIEHMSIMIQLQSIMSTK